MSSTDTFPPRIHVAFAPTKNIGVVFRRGPSKQVATFLWDRSKDTFCLGQWLKGRIYERRVDISPDGNHMIYFAMNGKKHSEAGGSWTAISRPPFLKALDLYSKGDCWQGGGLFLSSNRYWLNDRHFTEKRTMRQTSGLVCDTEARHEQCFGSECPSIYYPKLIRDGWGLISETMVGEWHQQSIFEKPLPDSWILRKIAHGQLGSPKGKGCYWDEHEIENKHSGTVIPCPNWEWAEWDQGRLVWAESGKIHSANLSGNTKLKSEKILHDFSDYTFMPIKAPY